MSIGHCGVAAAVVAACAGLALGQPSFRALGFLEEDSSPSIAHAVSADGTVVVGMSNSSGGFRAFRWTSATGMVSLGAFENSPFESSQGFAVSGDGMVVGGASVRPASLNEDGSAFRWSAGEGLVYVGSLGGTEGGAVRGLSPDGSIMVGNSSSQDFSYRAFIWMNGGMVALPDIANQAQSSANAMSADAGVIAGSADINFMANPRAAAWTRVNGQYQGALLAQLNTGAVSSALAVTPDGHAIVGQSAGRAARWENGMVQDLGLLPGAPASGLYFASAVSADGETVVGLGDYNATQGTGTAVIWGARNGMRDLNAVLVNDFGLDLHGFTCFWARGISADGLTIVGYGFNSNGEQEAFIADLHSGPPVCYANCDGSTAAPVLNVNDFICFQTRFAAGDSYANCDGSTVPPVLNVNDFVCFQTRFAVGCR